MYTFEVHEFRKQGAGLLRESARSARYAGVPPQCGASDAHECTGRICDEMQRRTVDQVADLCQPRIWAVQETIVAGNQRTVPDRAMYRGSGVRTP